MSCEIGRFNEASGYRCSRELGPKSDLKTPRFAKVYVYRESFALKNGKYEGCVCVCRLGGFGVIAT
jgi:hypothetical protein